MEKSCALVYGELDRAGRLYGGEFLPGASAALIQRHLQVHEGGVDDELGELKKRYFRHLKLLFEIWDFEGFACARVAGMTTVMSPSQS